MASLTSEDPSGETPKLLERESIHKLTRRVQQLPDGRYKRTINVEYIGPVDNDQVAMIPDQELETLFRGMHITRESTVFERLPDYGWERTVTKHLQTKDNNEDIQISGEGSELELLKSAQLSSSQATDDAVPSVGLFARTSSPTIGQSRGGLSGSSSNAQCSVSPGDTFAEFWIRMSAKCDTTSTEARSSVSAVSPDATRAPIRSSESQAVSGPLFSAHIQPESSLSSSPIGNSPSVGFATLSQIKSPSEPTRTSLQALATPSTTGTSVHEFRPYILQDEYMIGCQDHFETITAQLCYMDYSLEELRAVDYAQGRYGITQRVSDSLGSSFLTGGRCSSSKDSVNDQNGQANIFGYVSRAKSSANGNALLGHHGTFNFQVGGSKPRKIASCSKHGRPTGHFQDVPTQARSPFHPVQSSWHPKSTTFGEETKLCWATSSSPPLFSQPQTTAENPEQPTHHEQEKI